MTPQELVTALLDINEERGMQLLQAQLPLYSESMVARLVYLIKGKADQGWHTNVQRSLVFSSYLLSIGASTNNTQYHALGLMARGDALRRMDRDEESLPFFDAAGEEFLAIQDEVGWARSRIGRVNACLRLNRTTEALKDAEQAHEIFMRHNKFLRAGQIDANAAIIHYEAGQYEQALRLFDRAIETYLLVDKDVTLHIARARGNKALTLAAQGKFREAVALHEQARATFRQHGEKEEISVAREELNIADIYSAQGHYSQALLLYNQSRALFTRHEMPFAAAEVAQQMCLCLVRLNKLREAGELAEETVAFFRSAPGQKHNLARSLMHLATAVTMAGEYQRADRMLREASAVLEEGGFTRLAALARLRRAELYFATDQWEASLHEVEIVADAFADQEDLPHLAQAMLLQGKIAEVHEDIITAHELGEQALDIARGQELLELQYLCHDLLGRVAERLGDYVSAMSSYDRAVRGIDELQSRLVLDERTHFLENKASIYEHAILMALRLHKKEQALAYVEKAKSRVLGDYLRNNIDIRLRVGDQVSEHLLQDLTRLREEQAWFSRVVHSPETDANLSDTAVLRLRAIGPATARLEMQKRERRIEHLLEQMHLHAVGKVAARARPDWTNSIITSSWPRLKHSALMLEYYLSSQHLYIFQLSSNGLQVSVVEHAVEQLERLLALWRTNLDLAGQTAGTTESARVWPQLEQNCLGLLQKLYALLIEPVSQVVQGYEQLIIVPYGLLHYLPFHCLYDGAQFLIERFDISYLPSAALMDICRQRGERIRQRGVSLQDALVMGRSEGGRLNYAVREAELVAHQLKVSCLLDSEARAAVLEATDSTRPVVHIAAHGLFRLDAPGFSYIQMADRQLHTIEVFNLDLAACSLVVLSACETGRAVVGGVDEVIGLGRGFLYAGAASLLPTFWKVDDASSAELMETFYQLLLHGDAKTTALANAQRVFLAKARARSAEGNAYRIHPYFWAAFHLIGDIAELV